MVGAFGLLFSLFFKLDSNSLSFLRTSFVKTAEELKKKIKEVIEGYLDVKEDISDEKIEFIGIQKVAL